MCSAPSPREQKKENIGGQVQNAAPAERAAQDGSGNGKYFSAAWYVGLFQAVLVCRVAAGRFCVGTRPLAEQVAQPDAGKRSAYSCSVCGAG